MTKPIVLVVVEGGIADPIVVGNVDVILLDWDIVEEGDDSTREYIEERIEEIEALPDRVKPTIDKDGILTSLRQRLADFEEMDDA